MAGHDRITPDGKRFFKELEELVKLQARVGFTANGKGYGDRGQEVTAKEYEKKGGKPPPTVADVAMWNELGTANSPARPFLRQSVDNNESKIRKMCELQLEALAHGETGAQEALKAVGALQVGLIQNEIRNGGFTPNAPSTIKKKGSAKPLIDTARMQQSVHYVIEQKGG